MYIKMKKLINRILIIMAVASMAISSCVDSYEDANPPRAKDGPVFNLSGGGDVIETPADGNFLGAQSNLLLTLEVISAEGLIDSVGVVLSDTLGTAIVDQASLSAVRGQKTGSIRVIYTSPDAIPVEADITLDVTLYDGQQPLDWFGKEVKYRKTSADSYDVTLVACTSVGLAGTYTTLASGFTGDGGGGPASPYTDLPSQVTFTEIRPGQYKVDDMSFGLYPEGYGDTPPPGNVNLCGTDISDRGDTDQYGDPFTITGTLNADGTVHIAWGNTWGDRGTVVCTPAPI